MRFNVLTFDGRLSAAAPEDDLGYGRHPLSDALHAGHEVIGQVRILSRDR